MTVTSLRLLALAALAFATAACDQGRTNPPDATVRVVNVAPGFAGLTFSREQTQGDDLLFKSGPANEAAYDEDTYDFNAYARNITTGGLTLVRTFVKRVATGTIYTFVLAQVGTGIQELVLEAPAPAANATDAQILAAHAAEGTAAMDLFIVPAGTSIAGATPWGSIGFLGTVAPRSVAAGDYEITLTAAGNRASVLYKSASFPLTAATSTAFVITPEAGDTLATLSVTAAQGGTPVTLVDQNTPASVRVINAAVDRAARDVAFNSQFTPPLFPSVPFAVRTAYRTIAPATDVPVNVTPPGNQGVFELDQKVVLGATRGYTLMFGGDAGVLTFTFLNDDRRRFFNESRLQFYNASPQFTGLDLLVLAAAQDPTTALQDLTLAPNAISAIVSKVPGSYVVYLRQTGTTTLVAGPINVTLASQGLYGLLATNGVDATTATLTLLDDFQ